MFKGYVKKSSKPRARRSNNPIVIKEDCEVIYFNSKSTEYIKLSDGTLGRICKLSNLFGGAEFEYMASRFTQPEVTRFFDTMERCNPETFLSFLKELQPNKKWTLKQETYWFCDGEPIRGIIAQMLGTMVRDTPTAKKRRQIVAQKLGLESITFKKELTPEDKQAWMKVCLDHKYIHGSEFAKILLATGNAILHEKPMRGSPNAWSYKYNDDPSKQGGDWLGQLLMQVREEIRDK